MYDLMIIDDEIDARERLISMIDWDHLPVQLVCQAADSDTAYELYLVHRPKIIITDINIPIISGLELAKEFAKLDSELRFIVITGYNDFSYAQQTVKLGAVDLLLKPIFPDAINQSLEKAIDYFTTLREKKASMASLQKLLTDNLPAIRETYLADLLHTGALSDEEVKSKFQELKIDCPGPSYAVALLSISRNQQQGSYEATSLLVHNTTRLLLESAGLQRYTFFDSHFRVNCLIGSELDTPDDLIEETLGKVKAQISFIAGTQLYAGIGRTVRDLSDVNHSYNEALTALNYQNVLSDETVIHYKNICHYETPFPTRKTLMDYLLSQFRLNNFAELESAMTKHFQKLSSQSGGDTQLAKEFTFEYMASLTGECIRLGINVEKISTFPDLLSNVFALEDPQDFLQYNLLLAKQLMNMRKDRQSTSNNYLIDRAKSYMKDNMKDENLCLDSVSDYVGLSRVYFCNLFHKEEGISFSNYLKKMRVEKAKELLRTTNMKVFEVSDATGFSNTKYFGYVFKQMVGLTPLEYQKKPI